MTWNRCLLEAATRQVPRHHPDRRPAATSQRDVVGDPVPVNTTPMSPRWLPGIASPVLAHKNMSRSVADEVRDLIARHGILALRLSDLLPIHLAERPAQLAVTGSPAMNNHRLENIAHPENLALGGTGRSPSA